MRQFGLHLQALGGNVNKGGFSWRRLLGISAFKARVSRKIGIPLTKTGRRQKIGSLVIKVLGLGKTGI